MPAVGREDIRESGEDLRHLGLRVSELSEEVAHLAQSYRNLYERLRLSQRAEMEGRPSKVPPRSWIEQAPSSRATPSEKGQGSGPLALEAPEIMPSIQKSLRALLERQGEVGLRLRDLSRHYLLTAGGNEPRRIRARLAEVGERCQNLRLSSDSLSRGTPRALTGLLDDLCELNSEASEDLVRFGQSLRLRGDGILAGKKQDLRYLQGDSWRRPA